MAIKKITAGLDSEDDFEKGDVILHLSAKNRPEKSCYFDGVCAPITSSELVERGLVWI